MGVLDWKWLKSLKPQQWEEDDMEEVYDIISEYALLPDDTTVEKLTVLFNLTHSIMKSKGEQAEALGEELEELESVKGKGDSHGRIKQLEKEVESLKKELKDEKKGSRSSRGRKDSGVREDGISMEKQMAALERELNERNRELAAEKRETEKMTAQTNRLEQEKRDLSRDVESLREELRECLKTMDSQQENWDTRMEHQKELGGQLREKNQQINQLLEDADALEKDNRMLQDKVRSLEKELKDGTKQMEGVVGELLQMRDTLQDNQEKMEEIGEENYALRQRVDELQGWKERREEELGKINYAIDRNIDEWKKVLDAKDEQIEELKIRLTEAEARGSYNREDRDVAELQRKLTERNKQLEEMHAQLLSATEEIDSTAKVIVQLREEKERDKRAAATMGGQSRLVELEMKLRRERHHLEEVRSLLKACEEEARRKDQEFTEMAVRLREYESGEYGLDEAIGELKECRRQVQVRDRQIEDLNQFGSQAGYQLQEVMEENALLRDRLGMGAREVDVTRFSEMRRREKMATHALQEQLESMEEEHVQLRMENRQLKQKVVGKHVEKVDDKVAGRELAWKAVEVEMQRWEMDKAQLEHENKKLAEENSGLRKGLQEVLDSIRNQDGVSDVKLEAPILEELLAALDTRVLAGHSVPLAGMRARVEALEGKNSALREELRASRLEGAKVSAHLAESVRSFQELASRVGDTISQSVVPEKECVIVPPVNLPEMPQPALDLVTKLSSQLVEVLADHEQKEAVTTDLEKRVGFLQRKIGVVRQQMGLAYNSYKEDKAAWEKEREKWEHDREEMSSQLVAVKIELDKCKEALDAFGTGDKNYFSELARQAAILKSNEAILCRKYTALEGLEKQAAVENGRLRSQIVRIRNEMLEKVGKLKRYKVKASYKIVSLQKSLELSVPLHALDSANQQYDELTAKYSDLLEREHKVMSQTHQVEQLEACLEAARLEKEKLAAEVVTSKEKAYVQGLAETEEKDLAKRLAQLEIQELSTRQHADHAEKMLELIKGQLTEVETRNSELESHSLELGRFNLELQATERELRGQLVTSSGEETYSEVVKQAEKAEAEVVSLQGEISQLKEVAEIACNQAVALEKHKRWKEKENQELKKQVVDLQSEADHKAVIAACHREISSLQRRCTDLESEVDVLTSQLRKEEAMSIRQERRSDDLEYQMQILRRRTVQRCRALYATVQSFRRQHNGCVPLQRQEGRGMLLIRLQEERKKWKQTAREAEERADQLEVRVGELDLEIQGLKEMLEAVKEGRMDMQVEEWQRSNRDLRVEAMGCRRMLEREQEKAKFLEAEIERMEELAKKREEEIARKETEWEERAMEWEDKINESTTVQTVQTADAGVSTMEIIDISPAWVQDKKDPAEVDALRQKCNQLEAEIVARDKIICELRSSVVVPAERDGDDCWEKMAQVEKAVEVAQVTAETQKERLRQRDETLKRYKEIMEEMRQEVGRIDAARQQEVAALQDALEDRNRGAHDLEGVDNESSTYQCCNHLTRINELTDEVAHLHASVSSLVTQLGDMKEVMNRWKRKAEAYQRDREACEVERTSEVQDLRDIIQNQDVTIQELQQERRMAGPGRGSVGRSIIEQLRGQLEEKEGQLLALTRMLDDLKLKVAQSMDDPVRLLPDNPRDVEFLKRQLDEAKHAGQKAQRKAQAETKRLQEELDKITSNMESLRNENKRLVSAKQKAPPLTNKELIAKNKSLQNELNLLKRQLEGSQESLGVEQKRAQSAGKLARWDESKKWQKSLQKKEEELKEKQVEIEHIRKLNQGLRGTVSRLEREKQLQELKLKGRIVASVDTEQVESLRRANFTLKEKVASLEAELAEERGRADEGVKAKIEYLEKRVESQERQIVAMEVAGKGSPTATKELARLHEKEAELQRQVMLLEEEKLELRLEVEQLRVDPPRLRERVKELEKYVEVLKEDAKGTSARSEVPRPSAELTRLQRENASLKARAALADKLQGAEKAMQTLTADNKRLKSQLQKSIRELENASRAHQAAIGEVSCLQVELEAAKAVTRDQPSLPPDLEELQEQLTRKARMLSDMKDLLKMTAEREQQHIREKEELVQEKEDLMQEKEELILENEELMREKEELNRQLDAI